MKHIELIVCHSLNHHVIELVVFMDINKLRVSHTRFDNWSDSPSLHSHQNDNIASGRSSISTREVCKYDTRCTRTTPPDNMDFPLCTTSCLESSPPINEIHYLTFHLPRNYWSDIWRFHPIFPRIVDSIIMDTAPTWVKYQKLRTITVVTLGQVDSSQSEQFLRMTISTANHIKFTLKALCPIHSTANMNYQLLRN